MANGDYSAFPILDTEIFCPGLTKRELFAVIALQSFISRGAIDPEDAARMAIIYADTLLRELEA